MTDNAIEAVGLSKQFRVPTERRTSLKERVVRGRSPAPKTFWALKDATFSVPKGSSLGLIGPNGSGKSTALKVLTGIYRPTAGRVAVNGSVSALLEVGAGFHPELTGRDNIRLNATILGFTGREIDRLMDRIIEFADIGEHIDGPIKHYSSGMYVRLGFAVAVMVRPEILLVDEVIAVGDEEFQRKCFDYLYGLRRSGTSMIVVSHGLGQITDLCDHALWLEQGVTKDLGAAREVVRAYLDDVNGRESQRARPGSAAGPGTVAKDAEGRVGSGEVRVAALDMLNEASEPTSFVVSGHPVTIRLTLDIREPVAAASFGIEFAHESGIVVASPHYSLADDAGLQVGQALVAFKIPEVPLLPGSFSLSTWVGDRGHTYDGVRNLATLKVRTGGDSDSGGLTRIPGTWSVGAVTSRSAADSGPSGGGLP